MDSRPNILFIMADDHASKAISAYGAGINNTPNLDRIAKNGMLFNHCYVTNSICTPSRAAILTGTHNHVNGVMTLDNHINKHMPNVAKHMRTGGYRTAIVGKWHLGEGEPHEPTGFDYWSVLPGQGDYWDPEFIEMPPGDKGAAVERHETGYADQGSRDDLGLVQPDGGRSVGERVTQESGSAQRKIPTDPSIKLIDKDDGTVFTFTTPGELSAFKFQRYMQRYLRVIQSVDDNVGRMLDYLDQKGLTENTLVIYTSDQGFFLGEHGWFDKRFMYEESFQMPFLAQFPKQIPAGSISNEIFCNIDFAPTFLELAGIRIPNYMQGKSALPLMRGGPVTGPEWENVAYHRYWMHNDVIHQAYAHYGCRNQRYKLIYWYNEDLGVVGARPGRADNINEPEEKEWELFDCEKDPLELFNLYNDSAYSDVVKHMTALLEAKMEHIGDDPIHLRLSGPSKGVPAAVKYAEQNGAPVKGLPCASAGAGPEGSKKTLTRPKLNSVGSVTWREKHAMPPLGTLHFPANTGRCSFIAIQIIHISQTGPIHKPTSIGREKDGIQWITNSISAISGFIPMHTSLKHVFNANSARLSPSRKRLRGARACSSCRLKKIKCSATLPACVACQQKDIRCTYPPLKRYQRAPERHLLEETTLEEEATQQHEFSSLEREQDLPSVSENSTSPPATDLAEQQQQQQKEPEEQQELEHDHQHDLVIGQEHELEHEPQQQDEADQRLEHQQHQPQRKELPWQRQSAGHPERYEETATIPLSSPAGSSVSWHPSSTGSVARSSGYSGPSRGQLDSLLDVFFKFIYPMPSYGFLHPETTRRRCRSFDVHRALPASICAVATLYLRREVDLDLNHRLDSSRRTLNNIVASAEDTGTWIRMAEESIWRSLESPSITKLQALLLVIHYYIETELFQRAFMLTATAARFATTMRLNYERHDLQPVAREVRRRTLWSLKMVERYFSIGLAEFDSLPMEVIYIDVPCSEEDFMAMANGHEIHVTGKDQVDGEHQNYRGEGGTYGLVMQLEAIRCDVMKLSRKIALLETPLCNLTDLFSHHLQTLACMEKPAPILEALLSVDGALQSPGSSSNGDGSISRWLPRLLLAHISWHQAHCDINRILLPGYSEAAPAAVLVGHDYQALLDAEAQCLHHAMRIIYILTALNQHSTQHHVLEFDTAICAYHATRLILFISRFGQGPARPSPEFAVSRAELCLAALKRFFRFSALVSPIIRELEESITIFSKQQKNKRNLPSDQSAAAANTTPFAGTLSDETQPGFSETTANEICTPDSSPATAPAINAEPGEGQTLQSEIHHLSSLQSQTRSDGHFSEAVRARQRLAVHSLLRRAELSNIEREDEEYQSSHIDEVTPGSDAPRHPAFSTRDNQQSPSARYNHGASQEERPRVVGASTATADTTAGSQSAKPHPKTYSITNNQPTKDKPRAHTAKPHGQEPTSTRSPAVPGLFAWWAPQDWAWLLEDQLMELGAST
ncbi:unnamed protein product [Fusarium fujikuroi]|nr:unnamed protein product [Fusarium fujikuroi]